MLVRYAQYQYVYGQANYDNVYGYGMHSIRMYMVGVWYAHYENVYGFGMHSIRMYMGMVCIV